MHAGITFRKLTQLFVGIDHIGLPVNFPNVKKSCWFCFSFHKLLTDLSSLHDEIVLSGFADTRESLHNILAISNRVLMAADIDTSAMEQELSNLGLVMNESKCCFSVPGFCNIILCNGILSRYIIKVLPPSFEQCAFSPGVSNAWSELKRHTPTLAELRSKQYPAEMIDLCWNYFRSVSPLDHNTLTPAIGYSAKFYDAKFICCVLFVVYFRSESMCIPGFFSFPTENL